MATQNANQLKKGQEREIIHMIQTTSESSSSEEVNFSPRENFNFEAFTIILDHLSVALQQQGVAYNPCMTDSK